MLGVDLGYYWFHRMSHEVNFIWAAHQVHHSSEDYNLTTALRQSVLQRYLSWVFYLPLAFFVPPSVCLVHHQFSLLYQFWIHTECVKSLGPLELILATPSHHRVHHGRNRYCIDKNYGGTLIIWDKIFGTFEGEREEDKVIYGLVHPLSSWDPVYTQLCHWHYMLQTAWRLPGLRNKMAVFVKGPGWQPGKPRLGETSDIPDVHAPVQKYDKKCWALWISVYAWLHFTMSLLIYEMIAACRQNISFCYVFLVALFILWTLTSLGHLYECRYCPPTLRFTITTVSKLCCQHA
ncbi:Alkylglycerol monooxygenase [Lamellibrachia satsuma]|nr:Alkylglycerol monooxygenase [Lamellibrachia satsuma]